ncbi:SGNH/GDSL hydrolase family protein [Thiospirochaeta perfilievii]|uniref:SGNH/GDSL hydrolase family protein n=1 Tax=Thiospirochaeta perfilievii TaxID=252967 RepID=A0A5C1Q7S6_9SPIO|nr:SGNH/GDSL hydrolase family protein [Thiospirochaeta perfilievii]QEN03437.1 SGNH/GDSL hydrolase family protein [Thiospirochaeta perfilievii]
MSGPKAPKDPEKLRPYFYIMRDKEIFGSKQKNGSGIQFIYENDGRLINSAKIVGNIENNDILEKFKTVDGFRDVVHSIGISIEQNNSEEHIEFIFQMYGKKDIYGGGTILSTICRTNGAESRIVLSDIKWMEDDFEPGQIKFIFKKHENIAKATVRLFLNDGYTAPKVQEENDIDFESKNYKKMIERSLVSMGNPSRLIDVINRAKAGEDVTVSYIGGSITQGAGAIPINSSCYPYQSYLGFKTRFGKNDNVKYIKAGVGGTPSELGMIRFDRDVIRDKQFPDIVVVEFAVNDYGDETKGDCYESLVRKILMLPNNPAVILLFSVFANDENLQTRLAPVGELYNLPMVSILDAVTPQFKLTEKDGRVLNKNQFFYDIYHPQNIGHKIMSDCIINLFDKINNLNESNKTKTADNTLELLKQDPAIGKTFENVKLLDRKNSYIKSNITYGGFSGTDKVLQSVEMDDKLEPVPQFPYNWMYEGDKNKSSFKMTISCKALLLVFKDSGETDVAKAKVFVNDNYILTADPHENGWVHCNPIIIINEKTSKEYNVEICIVDGDEDKKFTILGFGYVE